MFLFLMIQLQAELVETFSAAAVAAVAEGGPFVAL
jgi:hypothetical protein